MWRSHPKCAYIKRDNTIERREMRAGKLGGVCYGVSLLHFRLVSTVLSTAEGGWWGVNESWKRLCREHSSMSWVFWRQKMGLCALGLWGVGGTNSRPGFYHRALLNHSWSWESDWAWRSRTREVLTMEYPKVFGWFPLACGWGQCFEEPGNKEVSSLCQILFDPFSPACLIPCKAWPCGVSGWQPPELPVAMWD